MIILPYIKANYSFTVKLNNTQKIKLLILTPTLECGGSEKFVSLVCEHINTNIFSVCLVVIDNSNPFYEIKHAAVEIIDLKKNRVLFSLPAIRKTAENFKPDIIFSTANHLNLYLAIFKNRFSSNIKFIAREASIVSINSRQAKMPALYTKLIKKYYRRFDMIICQSAYMQQDLITHYRVSAEKAMVIHNATPDVLRTPTQPVKQNNEQVYKFITVARLSDEKGLERLIHAVRMLSIPFTYYIIGEGSKRNELQQLIDELQLQDKVFLAGQKKSPFSGLEDADLFLMGSYYEGFPNVLLEAGAHGIPVVAINVPGGIAEIITAGKNGLLVEDNDVIAFTAGIKKALVTYFDRDQIIETTQKSFSVSSMMAAIENIFLKLAPNK
jgi:glycosyltransferase involved in cell wall biosynthesis